MKARRTPETISATVTYTCAGCGMLHEFPHRSAITEVWCSGCGELIENKPEINRKTRPMDRPGRSSRLGPRTPERTKRKAGERPISVLIALVAGALAVFAEVLAMLASLIARGGPMLSFWTLFQPWWLFLIVWLGLVFRSQRAARIATLGGVFAALLLCNSTLRQQITSWGPTPQWPDLWWGTMRVFFRSLPLLVLVIALGTRSARDYYRITDSGQSSFENSN